MWQSSPSLGLRRAPRRRRSRAPKFAPRPSPSLSPSRTDVLRVTSATRRRSARARYRRRSLTTRRRRLKLVTTTAVATMTTRGARLAQARVLAPASRLARQELRRSRTQRALRCGQVRHCYKQQLLCCCPVSTRPRFMWHLSPIYLIPAPPCVIFCASSDDWAPAAGAHRRDPQRAQARSRRRLRCGQLLRVPRQMHLQHPM
ncbi:hypothetical protein T492DRAFT_57093 [Pavlovales sp. CCMP2436]|nr:hypothetical protein T492DRAFT_57093 [Pavlovales sp. CCMP2436]